MRSIETHGTFEEAIKESSNEARALARRIRELVAEVYPDVVEVPWPSQQVAGYGVGPKKMSEHFCYIDAHRNHVNIGFNYGADLPDPEHLLQGEGKKFRHVKIHGLDIVGQPALRALIEAAVKEREAALAVKK